MPTFLNLLELFLELSERCGASSRRSCGNVTFGVDVGVLCIKRSVSSVTEEHEDWKTQKREVTTGEVQEKKGNNAGADCWCDEKKWIFNEYQERTFSGSIHHIISYTDET